jgi:hypothetical protein
VGNTTRRNGVETWLYCEYVINECRSDSFWPHCTFAIYPIDSYFVWLNARISGEVEPKCERSVVWQDKVPINKRNWMWLGITVFDEIECLRTLISPSCICWNWVSWYRGWYGNCTVNDSVSDIVNWCVITGQNFYIILHYTLLVSYVASVYIENVFIGPLYILVIIWGRLHG